MNRWLFIFLIFATAPLAADVAYEVDFVGVDDPETEELLRGASQLVTLQDCPPATAMALQRRAEAEIDHLITALHSRAYFDAKITLAIDLDQEPAHVVFTIVTGPVYPLASFKVVDDASLDLAELGITLGAPAYPQT